MKRYFEVRIWQEKKSQISFADAMTVGQLIEKLKSYDPMLPVVNDWNDKEPIGWVGELDIDYCDEEIVTVKAVAIW